MPETDATVIARLKDAGTILLGKLKLTEGAYAQHHPEVDPPLNPWNHDLWCGASSSGSGVAVASGLCFAALGSDTGGSIRFPSAANGIVGLKPTWGRVSRAGALPLAYTLDHIGPMTRSVKDAAAMLKIIAGQDPDDPTSSDISVPDYLSEEGGVSGLRIGVDWNYCTDGVDPELVDSIKVALELLKDEGADVVDVSIPFEKMASGWHITCAVETAHAHRETYPARKDEYGSLGALIELGLSLPASAYLEQELNRREFKNQLNSIFRNVDLLICPSMTSSALSKEGSPEANEAVQDLARTLRFTAPFDYSGSPTLSIPWSMGAKGNPLSVQLIAQDFDESSLISAGQVLEQAGGHNKNHPDI